MSHSAAPTTPARGAGCRRSPALEDGPCPAHHRVPPPGRAPPRAATTGSSWQTPER